MSISSRSFQSYLESNTQRTRASYSGTLGGFTLVELLVTMSIFLIIVSAVVIRFVSFDSIILLKTLGYDVALSIREAQSYSISVLGNTSGEFRAAYGVSFTPDATEYAFFRDSGSGAPAFDGSLGVETISLYTLGSAYHISDVCVDAVVDLSPYTVDTLCSADGIDRIDVSFRRPEYRALFYAEGYGGSTLDLVRAEIKLQSADGDYTASVVVLLSGQIKVEFAES